MKMEKADEPGLAYEIHSTFLLIGFFKVYRQHFTHDTITTMTKKFK